MKEILIRREISVKLPFSVIPEWFDDSVVFHHPGQGRLADASRDPGNLMVKIYDFRWHDA